MSIFNGDSIGCESVSMRLLAHVIGGPIFIWKKLNRYPWRSRWMRSTHFQIQIFNENCMGMSTSCPQIPYLFCVCLFAWQVNKRSKNIRSTGGRRWKHHLPFFKWNAKPICGCVCHEKTVTVSVYVSINCNHTRELLSLLFYLFIRQSNWNDCDCVHTKRTPTDNNNNELFRRLKDESNAALIIHWSIWRMEHFIEF